MDILDDMGMSKLSGRVFFFFFKVDYSFKLNYILQNYVSVNELTILMTITVKLVIKIVEYSR